MRGSCRSLKPGGFTGYGCTRNKAWAFDREARLVFDHAAAQNLLGASVFWIRRAAALGGEQAMVKHWQIKRDGGKRGIVEIIHS